ncbi:hypothetical protein GCM10009775_17770 [Microbacterium aoyamense]|uniref:CobQ/CobB/MinD/ParA nucleotide binding domain-containing protein n=1 Tax=Microbacterium aoyamense TaxID=344166 RepID=A0ABP5B1Z0_9MICO
MAMDAAHGDDLASALGHEGIDVLAVMTASEPSWFFDDAALGDAAGATARALAGADALILELTREAASAGLVSGCDRAGVRIVPLGSGRDAERLAATYGLEPPHDLEIEAWRLADLLRTRPRDADAPSGAETDGPRGPRTIAVWGAAGAPGRSTVAIELAVELARGGKHVALVDADAHAPSIALTLGLADEGPGFAAACRQAELGRLDARELTRISVPLGRTGVDVLTGLNRPSRWPELSDTRVCAALAECARWTDHTVVDVASSLERDEEIVSDLEGPRRNAATLAALDAADLVVAVVGADPVGISRFLRAYPDLRAAIGATPVVVVANRLRPGTMGMDARGQVRRALDRFGGVDEIWFLPQDPRSVDAALLAGQAIGEAAPKSPFTLAVRRFVGEAIVPTPVAAQRKRPLRPAAKGRRAA